MQLCYLPRRKDGRHPLAYAYPGRRTESGLALSDGAPSTRLDMIGDHRSARDLDHEAGRSTITPRRDCG